MLSGEVPLPVCPENLDSSEVEGPRDGLPSDESSLDRDASVSLKGTARAASLPSGMEEAIPISLVHQCWRSQLLTMLVVVGRYCQELAATIQQLYSHHAAQHYPFRATKVPNLRGQLNSFAVQQRKRQVFVRSRKPIKRKVDLARWCVEPLS